MSGAFIPVVGGMFADALAKLLVDPYYKKCHWVGLVVIVILFPMLKIIAIVIYVAAALIQPIGDTKVADTYKDANSLLLVFTWWHCFANVLRPLLSSWSPPRDCDAKVGD